MFELAGVLVHTGTCNSGHYYSFIKERRVEQAGPHPWLHFNDTLVEPFAPADIGKCCFGGVEPVLQWDVEVNKPVQRNQVKPHSAYMLFYEKISPSAGASREAGGGPPRPAPGAPAAAAAPGAQVAPPRSDEVDHEVLGDAEAPAAGAGVPVKPAVLCHDPVAQVHVPEHIASEVWAENMHFFRDRYLIDGMHFDFLFRLIRLALQNSFSDADTSAAQPALGPEGVGPAGAPLASLIELSERRDLGLWALRLGCHFFVETLAHAKDKSSLPEWLQLLQMGLQRSPAACRWFQEACELAG